MVNCSICGHEIRRDRYNIFYTLERQDFPPSGRWQKSVDQSKSDVCPNCCDRMTAEIRAIFRKYSK